MSTIRVIDIAKSVFRHVSGWFMALLPRTEEYTV